MKDESEIPTAVADPEPHPSSSLDPNSEPEPGGSRELLKLAAPLILSQSFMTVQVFVDALLLSWHDPREMTASFPAVMWFWLGFALLQVTAGYTSTFVAQYTGANRPHRVGTAVWQGIHFAIVAGFVFLGMYFLAPTLIALSDPPASLIVPEITYLQILTFAAMPMLVMAAINGFFSGRGHTWTVLGIEVVGTAVNVAFALVMIPGKLGFPEMGIAGAGWSTVIGSWASAMLAAVLFLRKQHRIEFGTLSGWKPEWELFRRLMKYGGPAGMQMFLDVLVFTLFVIFVTRLGEASAGAATVTIRLNMVAFLPMMGLGQAVCILVGQRLGGDRPDLAEKSTYTGLKWTFGYMCLIATAYLLFPNVFVSVFEGDEKNLELHQQIAAIVPGLLICVAIYSIADSVNVTFAFALRGAGDTRFVTAVTFLLAWPIMVLPTYFAVKAGWSIYWAWGFASAHIMAMAVCFWLRFRSGKWKTMRVIEPTPVVE